MGSLFLLAFGAEVFFASLATAGSEAFFNKLLVVPVQTVDATPSNQLIRQYFPRAGGVEG
jgi:hypothetical protein